MRSSNKLQIVDFSLFGQSIWTTPESLKKLKGKYKTKNAIRNYVKKVSRNVWKKATTKEVEEGLKEERKRKRQERLNSEKESQLQKNCQEKKTYFVCKNNIAEKFMRAVYQKSTSNL